MRDFPQVTDHQSHKLAPPTPESTHIPGEKKRRRNQNSELDVDATFFRPADSEAPDLYQRARDDVELVGREIRHRGAGPARRRIIVQLSRTDAVADPGEDVVRNGVADHVGDEGGTGGVGP